MRRLRALKRQEIENKLKEIQQISGIDKDKTAALNLDEDWDPDQYDKEMANVFNDDYYNDGKNEVNDLFLEEDDPLKKPDLHLEELFDDDELPEEVKEQMKENEEDDEEEEEEEKETMEEEEEDELAVEKEDEETIQKKKEAEKLMDELYNLDYEDMIGDMPVRFHYTKVKPFSYGLTSEDIMEANDKELRQFVSMKKLAPYRDHEWRVSKDKIGKFKAMVQKRIKREEKEEKLSRKQDKKQRKKEKKERERKEKEMEEQAKQTQKKRKRTKKTKKAE